MEGLMDIKETSKFLKIGVQKLYIMAKLGQIPCFKLGGKWKFDPESLRKWWAEEQLIQERARQKETPPA